MVAYGKKINTALRLTVSGTHIYDAVMSYVIQNQCNYVQSVIFVVIILWIYYLVLVTVSLGMDLFHLAVLQSENLGMKTILQ